MQNLAVHIPVQLPPKRDNSRYHTTDIRYHTLLERRIRKQDYDSLINLLLFQFFSKRKT